MNRLFFLFFILLFSHCDRRGQNTHKAPTLVIDSVTGAPVSLPNPWKNAGCELLTDAEVQKLFNIDVKRDAYNARTLPDRGFCLRSWMKPDWKERESGNEKPGAPYREFKNTLVTQLLDYGTPAACKSQFDLLLRDQRHIYEEEVPRLGEGALWSTSMTSLMVKKSSFVLKITIDCTDVPHDNLEWAKTVARVALQKM